MIKEKQAEVQKRWGSTPPIKIIQHYTGTNKNDLQSGILALDNDFQNGRIKFNCDNAGIKQVIDEFYTWGGKGFFDGVMTVWFTAYNRKKILRKRDTAGRQNEYIYKDKDLLDDGEKYIVY